MNCCKDSILHGNLVYSISSFFTCILASRRAIARLMVYISAFHPLKYGSGLRFFKDLDILRLDLNIMGVLDFFRKLKKEFVDGVEGVEKETVSENRKSTSAQPEANKLRTSNQVVSDAEIPVDPKEEQLLKQEEYIAPPAPEEPLTEELPLEVPEDLPLTEDAAVELLEDKEALLQAALAEEQALLEEQLALRTEQNKLAATAQDPVNEPEKAETEEEKQASYLGNLEHTALIDQLLRVPREERNDDWVGNFLSHVATASFVCGDPQVMQGPDNFPYFQLFIPEANKPFQCYVLEHMLDDFLLENGLGVALEPREGQVEWVLTYGDLLHYSVHRTFAIPQDHPFGKVKEGDEVIATDEEVLVGAPSEHILPFAARAVIRSFLQAQGVTEPKVCLIDRASSGKGQDLVFNLVPEQFESQAHYRAIMQALGWFIPRYYSYIGAQERAFEGHFLPL